YRRPHQPAGAQSSLRNRPSLQERTVLTGRRLGDQPPLVRAETPSTARRSIPIRRDTRWRNQNYLRASTSFTHHPSISVSSSPSVLSHGVRPRYGERYKNPRPGGSSGRRCLPPTGKKSSTDSTTMFLPTTPRHPR